MSTLIIQVSDREKFCENFREKVWGQLWKFREKVWSKILDSLTCSIHFHFSLSTTKGEVCQCSDAIFLKFSSPGPLWHHLYCHIKVCNGLHSTQQWVLYPGEKTLEWAKAPIFHTCMKSSLFPTFALWAASQSVRIVNNARDSRPPHPLTLLDNCFSNIDYA